MAYGHSDYHYDTNNECHLKNNVKPFDLHLSPLALLRLLGRVCVCVRIAPVVVVLHSDNRELVV